MAAMTADQRDAFLRQPRIATLVTLTPAGPTAVPIWYEWDGVAVRMFTDRSSAKVRHIERDARVCLSVAEPAGVPEAWVTIEGEAAVEPVGGYELASRLAPRYYTPDKAAAALAAWQARADEWVVLRITPRRIRSLAPS
jgi:PPOX class probable F420-dependent enzyme